MGIQTYDYYVNHHLLPDIANFRRSCKEDIYEVFNDKETFPNLVPQYRVQGESGNCFAHCGILIHFYLQLVHNKQLSKNQAYESDLTRLMRNFYNGEGFHKYVMEDGGDTFHAVLDKLLRGSYDVPEDFGGMTYDQYVSEMKKHGPAIVKMFIGDDFKEPNQYAYEGARPQYADDEIEGHAMMLVGVMLYDKEEDAYFDGKDIYFILQNFWKDKQFLMVRRDYFRSCSVNKKGGTASVNFITYNGEFTSASHTSIYAEKAENDVSLSSHLLERPSSARNAVKLRCVDPDGKRQTRWA